MPNFTKKAIKETFIKLLDERPLNQITVKDIVEDCGINRNSFYYHYADLPALLEEVVAEDLKEIMESHPTVASLEEGFDTVVESILRRKRAVLHIYNSLSRDVFQRYLCGLRPGGPGDERGGQGRLHPLPQVRLLRRCHRLAERGDEGRHHRFLPPDIPAEAGLGAGGAGAELGTSPLVPKIWLVWSLCLIFGHGDFFCPFSKSAGPAILQAVTKDRPLRGRDGEREEG